MKKIFLYLILMTNSFISFAQKELEYTIIGNLPNNIHNTYAYLSPVLTDDFNLKDSALIINGHFVFKGVVNNKLILYNLTTEDANMNGWIVIEPGVITYNYPDDKLNEYVCARGTILNDQIADSILAPSFMLKQRMELFLKNSMDTTATHQEFIEQTHLLAKNYYANLISFIKRNIGNSLGECFFLIHSHVIRGLERDEILLKVSEKVKQKYNDINSDNTPNIIITEGQTYINFTGMALNNEQFRFSDIITTKSLILLDFWASWCVPCMKSMPEIVELYNNYKNKGLEIVGISLDENETFWKKAIEKNNMSWIQIISNKGKSDNIAKIYGVNQIPHTVLINSGGKIVGINLPIQELREKIKKTLR